MIMLRKLFTKMFTPNRNSENAHNKVIEPYNITQNDLALYQPVKCNADFVYWATTLRLSENKVLVCYRNGNDTNTLYALILTKLDNNSIISSTPIKCTNHPSYYITLTQLSSHKVLVCYVNGSDMSHIYTLVLTISPNDSIKVSTLPKKCNDHISSNIVTTLLPNNKVLMCYRNYNASNRIYACIITFKDDNTIYISQPIQCNKHSSHYMNLLTLPDGRILICYSRLNNGVYNQLCALILTITSNGIIRSNTPMALYTHKDGDFNTITTCLLSDTQILVCFSDNDYGFLKALTLNVLDNNTIAVILPAYTIHRYSTRWINLVPLSHNNNHKVLVFYVNDSDGSCLYVTPINISDTGIKSTQSIKCNNVNTHNINCVSLAHDNILVCYSNDDIDGYLYTMLIIDISKHEDNIQ